MADEFAGKLKKKLGEKFEGEISREIADFGGLLTRHAAVLLLFKENVIDVERKIALSQASSERLPFSFEARVIRIFPVQTYAG